MDSKEQLFEEVAISGGTVRITYVDKIFPSLRIQKIGVSGQQSEGIEIPVRSFGDVSLAALNIIARAKRG